MQRTMRRRISAAAVMRAALVVAVAGLAGTVASLRCPSADPSDVNLNAICMADCSTNEGIVVTASPLISSIKLGQDFILDFNGDSIKATSRGCSVQLSLPSSLDAVNLAYATAGAVIQINREGQLVVPPSNNASGSGSAILLDLIAIDFTSVSNNNQGLADLFTKITNSEFGKPVALELTGYAANQASITDKFPSADAGNPKLCLSNVGFKVPSSDLSGLGGLKKVRINGVPAITSGDARGVQLAIDLSIEMPQGSTASGLTLNLNTNVVLDLSYKPAALPDPIVIGTVILPKLSVVPGVNRISATSFVFPPQTDDQTATVRELFSKFAGGETANVIVGNGVAEGIPVLTAALSSLSIPQDLPPNPTPLVNGADVAFGLGDVTQPDDKHAAYLHSRINAVNPFGVKVSIKHIKATIFWTDPTDPNKVRNPCGAVDWSFDDSFVIPAGESAWSPNFTNLVDVSIDECQFGFAIAIATDGATVEIESTLTIKLGDAFENTIDYTQSNVLIVPNLTAP